MEAYCCTPTIAYPVDPRCIPAYMGEISISSTIRGAPRMAPSALSINLKANISAFRPSTKPTIHLRRRLRTRILAPIVLFKSVPPTSTTPGSMSLWPPIAETPGGSVYLREILTRYVRRRSTAGWQTPHSRDITCFGYPIFHMIHTATNGIHSPMPRTELNAPTLPTPRVLA